VCEEYDQKLDIMSTKDSSFNASIAMNIEPGNLSVYDITKDEEHLNILTRVGDNLFIDLIDL
jgi:hypothetical protein